MSIPNRNRHEAIATSVFWDSLNINMHREIGFPGDASGKEPVCQCRRHKRWGLITELGLKWLRTHTEHREIYKWKFIYMKHVEM